MQQFSMNSKLLEREYWRRTWPVILILIIIIVQLLLNFAIVSLETASAVLSVRGGFAGVGFITSFFFFITAMSGFTVVCCNRDSKIFATHALIQNVISLIGACVLIYFDSRIIKNPQECLWPRSLCLSFGTLSVIDQTIFFTDIPVSKSTIVKVQLATAVLMLCSCLSFAAAYIYTLYKVSSELKRNRQTVAPQTRFPAAPVYPSPANYGY